MRKITILLVFSIIITFICGCNSKTVEVEKQNIPYFSDSETARYLEDNFTKVEFAEEISVNAEMQGKLNQLLENLTNFLNNEYSASWKHGDVSMYEVDMTSIASTVLNYGAMYQDEKLYIDKKFFEKENFFEDQQIYYVISHELIHYLFAYNNNSTRFMLFKDGKACGLYLEEAFVDELARRYAISKGFDSDNLKSSYKYSRCAIDLLSISNTQIFSYFFKADISGLQKYLNDSIEKRIECVGDPFEKMLTLLDCCIINPNEKSVSVLFTFTIAMTPKEQYNEFNNRQKETFGYTQDFFNLMK